MDLAEILFNKNKPFTPVIISGGSTNGRVRVENRIAVKQHLIPSEMEALEDDVSQMRRKLEVDLKAMRVDEAAASESPEINEVYQKYEFNQRSQHSNQLPIWASKARILSKIAEYPSIVVEGSTGCGKSTQLPQMILDEAKEKGKPCNIVVTQPRRIAARSIAEHVANERGWDLGTIVGYQIGLDKRFVSPDTRILFCTTGILLEKLIQAKSLANFTHIILDEVHERDKDMDFLFIIIRMLMAKEITNVKIILMSATIDSSKFSEYFRFNQFGDWLSAPVVKVDQRNLYKVREIYLNDFDGIAIPEVIFQKPGISDDMYTLATRIMKRIENDKMVSKSSSILIFLPGIYEIGRLHTKMNKYIEEGYAWKVFILHSLISTEEQQSIFRPVEGARKIILSTNIAESSITVPDVTIVIDFCLMKYLKNDSSRNCTRLELEWASRNNCRQRSGRAGRVSNGTCYRLITERHFKCLLRESAIPELQLSPLENLVLKAKTFEMGPPHVILGLAMDRPQMEDVANTVLTLKEIGAMQLKIPNIGFSAIDGDLTFLGRLMSSLPIDVRSTKMIALGYCYGVLEECIIMAAGLTSKSIFKVSFERSIREYSRRLEWSNGSGSDLFAVLNAYRIWTMKYNQGEFGRKAEQRRAEHDFCNKHGLDVRSMNECHQLVQELTKRLDKLGIKQITGVDRLRWTDREKSIILKVVIAGALYPNFFATVPICNPSIEHDIFRSMNGRDPNTTVFFSGFRKENIRQLYVEPIRKLFKNGVVDEENIGSVKVSFDDSEKVFVTFEDHQKFTENERNDWDTKRCSIPGKTLPEVYKAIKMRKMRMPTDIHVMNPGPERAMAEKLGIGVITGMTFTLKEPIRDNVRDICIPNASKKDIAGIITHVENCSKFWFQPESERPVVEVFQRELNEPGQNQIIQPCVDHLLLNQTIIIVARDQTDQKLYRARLIACDFDHGSKIFKGTVCFIDTGRTQKCQLEDLFMFTQEVNQSKLPPRCFQCRLAEIQASTANISGGLMWERDAVDRFKSLVSNTRVTAEIYSIVNGISNVFIILPNATNVNDILIKERFGEFSDENFLSKNNRWKRQNMQNSMALACSSDFQSDLNEFIDCDEYYPIVDAEPLKAHDELRCDRLIRLNGPRSPLESEVYSVLVSNDKRSVEIDHHSVNSVFLTSLQQNLSIKYMVAAHTSQKGAENSEATVHETTLLPNIRGFGALMAMVFCPAMDLKRDQWKSRYISVRTGLGYSDEKKTPYFAEHDAVFPLDFEFTEDDLAMVNHIRYSIDSLLFTFENKNASETLSSENKNWLMKKLKELTIKMLTKERPAIEINTVKHEWKEYKPQEFKEVADVYLGKSIFPVHGLVHLEKNIQSDVKKQLIYHCNELHKMTVSMNRPVMCQLCVTDIENVAMLRTHLMSRLHKDREMQIGFQMK